MPKRTTARATAPLVRRRGGTHGANPAGPGAGRRDFRVGRAMHSHLCSPQSLGTVCRPTGWNPARRSCFRPETSRRRRLARRGLRARPQFPERRVQRAARRSRAAPTAIASTCPPMKWPASGSVAAPRPCARWPSATGSRSCGRPARRTPPAFGAETPLMLRSIHRSMPSQQRGRALRPGRATTSPSSTARPAPARRPPWSS